MGRRYKKTFEYLRTTAICRKKGLKDSSIKKGKTSSQGGVLVEVTCFRTCHNYFYFHESWTYFNHVHFNVYLLQGILNWSPKHSCATVTSQSNVKATRLRADLMFLSKLCTFPQIWNFCLSARIRYSFSNELCLYNEIIDS